MDKASRRLERCARENEKSLDLSGLKLGPDDAREVARLLPGCGALSKLTFGGDKVNSWDDEAPEPAVLEVGMAEADLSNKGLKAGGAIIVGAWISHKDHGTLTSLNISSNSIGGLVWNGWRAGINEAWKYYHSDGRKQDDDPGEPLAQGKPEGVIALANIIQNNGALVKLNMSSNDIRAEGGRALAEALKDNKIITELNIASNTLGYNMVDADMSGVIAISNAIPTMGALVKLKMGNNSLEGTEAGKALGDAIAVNTMLKELDLSSPQDKYGDSFPCDAVFAKEFAAGLSANGALTSLNLTSNELGLEGAKHVAEAIKGHVSALLFDRYCFELDLTSGSTAAVYGYSYHNTATKGALETFTIDQFPLPIQDIKTKSELDFSGKSLTANDAVIIAALIPLNVGLSTLIYGDKHAFALKVSLAADEDTSRMLQQMQPFEADLFAAFVGSKCQPPVLCHLMESLSVANQKHLVTCFSARFAASSAIWQNKELSLSPRPLALLHHELKKLADGSNDQLGVLWKEAREDCDWDGDGMWMLVVLGGELGLFSGRFMLVDEEDAEKVSAAKRAGRQNPGKKDWPTAHYQLFCEILRAHHDLAGKDHGLTDIVPLCAGGIRNDKMNINSAFNNKQFAAGAKGAAYAALTAARAAKEAGANEAAAASASGGSLAKLKAKVANRQRDEKMVELQDFQLKVEGLRAQVKQLGSVPCPALIGFDNKVHPTELETILSPPINVIEWLDENWHKRIRLPVLPAEESFAFLQNELGGTGAAAAAAAAARGKVGKDQATNSEKDAEIERLKAELATKEEAMAAKEAELARVKRTARLSSARR